jgi:hypothetical protein
MMFLCPWLIQAKASHIPGRLSTRPNEAVAIPNRKMNPSASASVSVLESTRTSTFDPDTDTDPEEPIAP